LDRPVRDRTGLFARCPKHLAGPRKGSGCIQEFLNEGKIDRHGVYLVEGAVPLKKGSSRKEDSAEKNKRIWTIGALGGRVKERTFKGTAWRLSPRVDLAATRYQKASDTRRKKFRKEGDVVEGEKGQ